MKYILLIYAPEAGWNLLTPEQQKQGVAAYNAYTEALNAPGVRIAETAKSLARETLRDSHIFPQHFNRLRHGRARPGHPRSSPSAK